MGNSPRYREDYPCCRLMTVLLNIQHSRVFPETSKKKKNGSDSTWAFPCSLSGELPLHEVAASRTYPNSLSIDGLTKSSHHIVRTRANRWCSRWRLLLKLSYYTFLSLHSPLTHYPFLLIGIECCIMAYPSIVRNKKVSPISFDLSEKGCSTALPTK